MSPVVGTALEGSDAELARRLQDGDPESFAQLRRWIRGATGPYRGTLANDLEDVEQEVVSAVVVALREDRLEGRASLATYVRRAAVYRCINRLRDRRRRPAVSFEGLSLVSDTEDPLAAAQRADELRHALRVMRGMPEHCRRLWSMVLEGLDYRAMSDRLGVGPGALRVRMLRCRRGAHQEWLRLTGGER